MRDDPLDQRQISDFLSKGDVDLAVSSFADLALDVRKVSLYQQRLMGITRRAHPQVRGELTLIRAARALAAIDGADQVGHGHLRRVAPLALRHRLRRNPLDDAGSTVRVGKAVEELLGL